MCASALQEERLVSGVYSRIVTVIVSQTAVVEVIVGMLVIASVVQIEGFIDRTFPKDSRQHLMVRSSDMRCDKISITDEEYHSCPRLAHE